MIVACLAVAALGYVVASIRLLQWLRSGRRRKRGDMLRSCDACGCAEGYPFVFGSILICRACAQAELTALHSEIVSALWDSVKPPPPEAISEGEHRTDALAEVTAEPADVA